MNRLQGDTILIHNDIYRYLNDPSIGGGNGLPLADDIGAVIEDLTRSGRGTFTETGHKTGGIANDSADSRARGTTGCRTRLTRISDTHDIGIRGTARSEHSGRESREQDLRKILFHDLFYHRQQYSNEQGRETILKDAKKDTCQSAGERSIIRLKESINGFRKYKNL